jgi:hypothetical protein
MAGGCWLVSQVLGLGVQWITSQGYIIRWQTPLAGLRHISTHDYLKPARESTAVTALRGYSGNVPKNSEHFLTKFVFYYFINASYMYKVYCIKCNSTTVT